MPRRTQDTARLYPGFRIRGLHPLWPAFQCRSAIPVLTFSRSYNPGPVAGLGSSGSARRYSRNHFCFLLLQVLRCFNSLGCPRTGYVFTRGWYPSPGTGFPHSDTPGSLRVYRSPGRFAVNCVLLRLYMPRHPPYALCHLIT